MADGQTQLGIDSEWANRSQYWISQASKSQAKRLRRERQTAPLVLTGHGLSIRVDKSCLLIRVGNTHYPAEKRELRFFRGSLDVPPRIVLVDGSGNISIDAIDWMAEQSISLVRISYDGSNASVLSPNGFAADPKRVAWQRETRDDPKRQLKFAVSTIERKLKASIETLSDFIPESLARDKAIAAAKSCLVEIKSSPNLSAMLGIEGKAAQYYWRAWQGVTLNWKAKSRYPIPEEWRHFKSRSSVLNSGKLKNLRASNPVNAMLNYAYAVLLTDVRIRAIADSYDPMLGILHDQKAKKRDLTPSFALDLMEPLRPVVDRAVLKLVRQETFTGADFVLQSDGVCRLSPNLATLVSAQVSRSLMGAHYNDSKSGNLGRPHGGPTRQQTD